MTTMDYESTRRRELLDTEIEFVKQVNSGEIVVKITPPPELAPLLESRDFIIGGSTGLWHLEKALTERFPNRPEIEWTPNDLDVYFFPKSLFLDETTPEERVEVAALRSYLNYTRRSYATDEERKSRFASLTPRAQRIARIRDALNAPTKFIKMMADVYHLDLEVTGVTYHGYARWTVLAYRVTNPKFDHPVQIIAPTRDHTPKWRVLYTIDLDITSIFLKRVANGDFVFKIGKAGAVESVIRKVAVVCTTKVAEKRVSRYQSRGYLLPELVALVAIPGFLAPPEKA